MVWPLPIPFPPTLPFLSSRVAWIGPNVRASNEGLLRPRVPRAGRAPGRSRSLLFEQLPHPRFNLVQAFAQVSLKHISFGLHHHAFGLELVLKQHQLGK
jgi:hypothetical protein